MVNVKSYPILGSGYFALLVLCLAACQNKPAALEPIQSANAVPNTVVLMDPTIDDAMLPAIGETLSDGQVTIYPLDPNTKVPLPVGAMAMSRQSSAAPLSPVTLKQPAGGRGDSSSADGVTVYSLDTGVPAPLHTTTIRPALQPPVQDALLPSPFGDGGEITAQSERSAPAVPKASSKLKRPPKGMTY